VQTVITSVLSLITPGVDYFSALFLSLSVQAMYVFPLRTGSRWVAGFAVIMAILMLYGHPFSEGLPLVIIMSVAYFFIGSYAAVTREAEAAHARSQRLLAELQDAHEQLQVYTAQAEELAVAAERSRLARDLHDSVTQSLYSLTLFTQAARELAEAGNLKRTQHNLGRIADTAAQALKEMRLLVYELRPLALEETGLVGALRRRLDMVEGRAGVQTHLLVEPEGDVELPAPVEEALYRFAEEALNNALKHARATSVTVRIADTATLDGQRLEFEVFDDGCGFDLEAVKGEGGLGLTSIRERADELGGTFSVTSAPGKGTRVKVSLETESHRNS
jgi:signal transduction histidine kinase